jgi:hypothetical protein
MLTYIVELEGWKNARGLEYVTSKGISSKGIFDHRLPLGCLAVGSRSM